MSQAFMADDMLRYAAVHGFPNVYVVGCLESRVSIYSHQVRALNLVWALADSRRLVGRAPSSPSPPSPIDSCEALDRRPALFPRRAAFSTTRSAWS